MTADTKQSVANNPQEFVDEDIVASNEEEKNYKGICIAICVIACICSLIITSIILLTPDDDLKRVKYPRLKIEEIVANVFQPKDFDGIWISDNEFVYTDENSIFSVSADKQFVLLTHDIQKVRGNLDLDFAEFGPKGNQIVYIYQNNIYYKRSVSDNGNAIIKTGQPGIVYNGVPDWLYGERIWKSNRALWWNPLGTGLSFASFDDSLVDSITYLKYGSYESNNNLMPEITSLKYPKPGTINPSVSLWTVDLTTLSSPQRLMQTDMIGDHYLTSVSWIDNNVLATVWMNRQQNCSLINICSQTPNWMCRKNFEQCIGERSKTWSELFDKPLVTSDKKNYLIGLPVKNIKSHKTRQISLISIATGIQKSITIEDNDVTQVLAYSETNQTVFYEASLARNPSQKHIFSKSRIFANEAKNAICLTCDQIDRNCTYQTAIFSPNTKYFMLICLGMGIPWVEIRSVAENKILLNLGSEEKLRNLTEFRAFPQLRVFQASVDNLLANIKLILPPGLRENEEIKFPLVVQIGSEPEDQDVKHNFHVDWGTYLASSRDFIYAYIDVRVRDRGIGDTLLHDTWHRIGDIEVNDYMKIIEYLKLSYKYIDPSRIAIWGWAYGGYIAAMSLIEANQQTFNCSLAVAPITNWLYWDSFTSERYFGSPDIHRVSYERANLIQKADKFKQKRFFILHGTADDAVHLEHSFKLMKALNRAGVLYRSQIYPDSNHYLEDVRLHVYRSLETYLDECFGLEDRLIEESHHKKKSEEKS
ncbi:dipeptidyl aminopeptidase-like protein 6 [Oppia nitens]|uniref:dipeptidyl aminopeptidase-like protein 6 n=1 Tax=Oppia nitens TaxID=1686743 RepID=UPI0023DB5B51|nr:dipeptidyl aminopeptidase-like protein 6 [Oppia nitens]